MNKSLTLFYFGAVILGATSHAMDPSYASSLASSRRPEAMADRSEDQTSPRLRPTDRVVTPEELGLSLRVAARDGNIKQVETLLKQGAPIDAKDNDGWTPLIYAAGNGHEQICKFLIENKATIDAKNNFGWTPLRIAAYKGHEQTCKLLIDNKASIYAKNNNGWTPLMYAASYEHEQICKLLIDALLVPVKEKQAAAIALLGIKKHRNISGFRHIDREVIRLIVRPAYECSKRHLFDQINAIQDQDMKQRLVDYAKQQLRMQN